MQAELTTGIDQTVSDERFEHVGPTGAFARRRQARLEELVECEQVPQMKRQPAGAELARVTQLYLRDADAHGCPIECGKLLAVIGNRASWRLDWWSSERVSMVRHPAGALGVVELALMQQLALDDASAAHATGLDDASIAVQFAVFAVGPRAQEHGSSLRPIGCSEKGVGRHYKRFGASGKGAASETKDLRPRNSQKNRFSTRIAKVGLALL